MSFLILICHFYSLRKCCKKNLALERKISVRANRDELIERGILLPESPMTTIPEPGNVYIHTSL